MKVGIVGLGLIGGSLAKALKAYTPHRVMGADLDANVLSAALAEGAVDEELTPGELGGCDVVLIALFPKTVVSYINAHEADFNPRGLIIDCGGVKGPVMEGVAPVRRRHTWQFIGGHPMAGREFCGYFNTQAGLFQGASMILTPYDDTPTTLLAAAGDFFKPLGFSRIQVTTPEIHDRMIAYTSQLAHVVSNAYVKGELAGKHAGFSAGSFGDMTRVARLNEEMWTQLFMDNRGPLLHELDGLMNRLTQYREALNAENADALRRLLKEGREIKERIS